MLIYDVVFAWTASCLVLLGGTAAMAQTGLLLAADYSEWLYPNAGKTQIATDSSGALYILSIFPGTSLSAPPTFLVTKLSADGKTILWQNNLGFASDAMAVDPSGGVYVLSSISSPEPGGPPAASAFVAKLGTNGSGIAWKTPVPSFIQTAAPILSVDPQGRTYVAGAHDVANGIGGVVRLAADGSGVEYTVKVTGILTALAVDTSGGAFVAGSALSPSGTNVSFLARLTADGSTGFYSTLPPATYGISVAVDPQGNAVVYMSSQNEHGVLHRFDSTGAVTLSRTAPMGSYPALAVDAAGNMYVTGSSPSLTPVRNTLATCGLDLLSVFAPDGSLLQTTYIPGGVSGSPLIAVGAHSTAFLVDRAGAGFTPSQTGPFPSGPSTNPGQTTTAFLWRLSPNSHAQTFPVACLGNAASYADSFAKIFSVSMPIAPGMMVSLFGNGLGPAQGIQTQATLQSPFPTQAENVQVTFDGHPASLLWVQEAQINAVAPWSLTPGATTQVCVSYNNVKTNCLALPVAQSSPGVFTTDGVHASALNQDGTINSADNPASVGTIVSVFATGLGAITPVQSDGTLVGLPLPANVAQAAVQAVEFSAGVGGGSVTPFVVTYAGPAPYLVAGTSQINFQVVNYKGLIFVQLASAESNGFQIYVVGQ